MTSTARHQRTQSAEGRLYRDASFLAASSMLTAMLGMLFWAVIARELPVREVGVQSALLALMTAPAIAIAAGVGDAFTALVPPADRDRPEIVRRGYRIAVALSVAVGVIAGIVAVTTLPQVHLSVEAGLLVAVGTIAWTLFSVQDPALTSMGRASWLPIENGTASTVKIGLVMLLAGLGFEYPIIIATILPAAAAVAVLYPRVRELSARTSPTGTAKETTVAALAPLVRRTTPAVALTIGTVMLLPFAVTALSGPLQGATFALSLAIAQSLDFLSAALGVSLVVHASARPHDAGRIALSVLRRSLTIVVLGAAVIIALSPVALGLLNKQYLHLHGVAIIAILCTGSVLRVTYVVWAALQRSRRNMRPLLIANGTASAALYLSLPFVCHHWGALGAAIAVAAMQAGLSTFALAHVLIRRYRRGVLNNHPLVTVEQPFEADEDTDAEREDLVNDLASQ